jgi:beta-galactosidase/beta-glucuronidase
MKNILSISLLLLTLAEMALADDIQSLAGSWRFQIAGADAGLFRSDLPDTTRIPLPGTMDDAARAEKHQAAHIGGAIPSLRLRRAGGSQREIEIPAGWAGQRVELFLERCRWVTTVWLDDKLIGTQDSLVTPHVYDLGTDLKPGKHRLTICVDNSLKLELGRFVSALRGGTWGNMNGITGRIELTATPPVWIADVQVYPNLAKKSALVKTRIGNATGQPGKGTLSVGLEKYRGDMGCQRWDGGGGGSGGCQAVG